MSLPSHTYCMPTYEPQHGLPQAILLFWPDLHLFQSGSLANELNWLATFGMTLAQQVMLLPQYQSISSSPVIPIIIKHIHTSQHTIITRLASLQKAT